MLVITVSNQKGGVGKTTTCVNLAAELGRYGYSVLLADVDPQGNSTSGLGVSSETLEISLYDVLLGEASPEEAVVPTKWEGVSVLPSTIDLAGAEIELAAVISREARLRSQLAKLRGYDVVLVDCPPSLGILTVNALTATDRLIIPIQCEYYALEGVGQLLRTVELIRESLNPKLNADGILLTMYDSRTKLSMEVAEEVRRQFGAAVFLSIIPRNVRLSEAPSHGAPICYYDPTSSGARAYAELAKEVSDLWLRRAR